MHGVGRVFYRMFGGLWTALGMAWLAGLFNVVQLHIHKGSDEAVDAVLVSLILQTCN